jgi:chorismate-pyruvate lyase
VITAPELELLHPLPALYRAANEALPDFEIVEATVLPPAAHRLLVHSGDMTSKLEEFFADEMRLRVLQCEHTPEHYRREVILFCSRTSLPVEYGAIEINLGAFEEPLRSEIVSGKVPLGGLLNRQGVRYRSEPRAFLRVQPCDRLTELFALSEPATLSGRSNRLLSADGVELARIVEILRPV